MRSKKFAAILASLTTVAATAFAGVSAAPAHAVEGDAPVPPEITMPGSPDGIPSAGNGPQKLFTYPASLYSLAHPGTNPQGANDFGCKPREGDNPVVLLPGTNSDAYASWSMYSPKLTKLGYCVFSPNFNGLKALPNFAYTGDIRVSAKAVAGFVDRILEATGSTKVDIIGWSQGGGPLPNYYITKLGGDKKVDKLIALAPSNHGVGPKAVSAFVNKAVDQTKHEQIETAFAKANIASYEQQLGSSRFNKELYGNGPVTRPGIKYTIIEGRYDDTVVPFTNAFLYEPGVTNILVQNICPSDHASHINFTYDVNVYQMAVNALDPDQAKPVVCAPQPFLG
ncbi:alpha/beta fold hydrolase [Cutibacterium equinum]|uniref:Alpha/beta fold hydrolase n=1 Tax=Cutibacterium equinum TaxID=3016342 RepID=A0ABY7QWQ5_9ACTN|nr:alpha/beta fold hydrolase [Cutibacterium equinum]WCC79480.1 alpha/beta fold hydrolase [Cutibacterium equinum]